MQAIVQDNNNLIAKYQSEIQNYQSKVQAELGEYQNKIQKQQAYAKEAEKYYAWAQDEVTKYIQNNSKMINRTIAAQAQGQGQRQYRRN